MTKNIDRLTIGCAILASAWVAAAHAGDRVVANTRRGSAPAVDLSAVPAYRNPLAAPSSRNAAERRSPALTPGTLVQDAGAIAAAPRAFGSFGIPYSSTPIATGASSATGEDPNYLATTFPYRAVGKLTFSAGFCTASLIRRSVLVTAAHCIQRFGTGPLTFGNFQFTPAAYDAGVTAAQRAPYGTWSWAAFIRPAGWASGTDIGSGSARDNDLAVMALARNADGRFVGDLTGWFGYAWNNYSFTSSSKTGDLAVAAVTTLGYPALLDAGGRMQRNDGPTYLTTIGGAGQLWQGSNFTGGASGGPWIVNFHSAEAELSGGAEPGAETRMAVVGVTSWGSSDPNEPKDNYSSQFRQNSAYPAAGYGSYGAGNIAALLDTLCAMAASGEQTYAQQGYCD